MATVNVIIAGKTYRMACGDGEERHLEALAALYDTRIEDMRRALGELGDMRLHVMAALTLADEMTELKRRVEVLEGQLDTLRTEADGRGDEAARLEEATARALQQTAERIGRVAKALAQQTAG